MASALNKYDFSSPIQLVHTITHPMRTLSPDVVVYDQSLSEAVVPEAIEINSDSQITITFFAARAIYGTIS